jgi:putative ABC transport system permease protein
VSALTRKAWRDLWHLRGQALAIALVIAGGVATLVMSQSTYESLTATREQFYRQGALADLWAPLKRAPDTLLPQLAAIPGVQTAQARLLALGTLGVPGFNEPVRAEVVSLPVDGGQPLLNRVQLRSGRLPDPERDNEVVVGEAFAAAQALRVGDRLRLTLRGRQRWLQVVGVGTSPEYVYQSPPGAVFPDFKRYAVLWMNRHAMEKALNMDGAFDNVTLRLLPGARAAAVIAELDHLLARYGGVGAYGRHEQTSARYLEEEMRQLQTMARLFPAIFLGVAAFLLHVVLMRLVGTQRDQIGVLKAFGYSHRALAVHYLGMAAAIALLGAALGIATAVLIGYLIYRSTLRLNLGRFFAWTGGFLILVAAGVLAYGVHDLQEARFLPGLNDLAFDVSDTISPTSWLGTLLKGTLNFSPATTKLEAAVWLLYVVPVMVLFLRQIRRSNRPSAPATAPAAASR